MAMRQRKLRAIGPALVGGTTVANRQSRAAFGSGSKKIRKQKLAPDVRVGWKTAGDGGAGEADGDWAGHRRNLRIAMRRQMRASRA
jgi:hypothetical protein